MYSLRGDVPLLPTQSDLNAAALIRSNLKSMPIGYHPFSLQRFPSNPFLVYSTTDPNLGCDQPNCCHNYLNNVYSLRSHHFYAGYHLASNHWQPNVQETQPSSVSYSTTSLPYLAESLFHLHPHPEPHPRAHPRYPHLHPRPLLPKITFRKRPVFNKTQRNELEKTFRDQRYISKSDRIKLADEIGLKETQIKVWFINRRTKWKKEKEKEREPQNKP